MPESVKRRGSSGPTIGAIVGLSCFGSVAMGETGYSRCFRRGAATFAAVTDIVERARDSVQKGAGDVEGDGRRRRGRRNCDAAICAGTSRGDRAAITAAGRRRFGL